LERLSAYQILIIKQMMCIVGTRLSTQMECCIVDDFKDTD